MLWTLCKFAFDDGYRPSIVQKAGFALFLEAILTNDEILQSEAATCLNHLTLNENAALQIVYDGGIFAMVDLLKSHNADIQLNASAAIANTCILEEAEEMLLQMGSLETISSLYYSPNIQVQEYVRHIFGILFDYVVGDMEPTKSNVAELTEQQLNINTIWLFLHAADVRWQQLAVQRLLMWTKDGEQCYIIHDLFVYII